MVIGSDCRLPPARPGRACVIAAAAWVLLLAAQGVPVAAKCDFRAVFNFGDSNSETGGFWAAFPAQSGPFGMTYFGRPAGRASDGRAVIDFLAQAIGIPFLSPYLQSIGSNYKHGANYATAASTVLLPNTSVFVSGISPFSLAIQLNQMKHVKVRAVELSPQARPEIIATTGCLVRCTFMAALWEIWCSRNKARFQNQGIMAKHIINRTMLSNRAICISFKFQKVSQPWLATLHQIENGKEKLKSKTPSIVRWLTPPSGRLKLNVDGAFIVTSGRARGGGILHDHEGNICWAFARAYHDLNSSLAAEAMALKDGLSICYSWRQTHYASFSLSLSRNPARGSSLVSCMTSLQKL